MYNDFHTPVTYSGTLGDSWGASGVWRWLWVSMQKNTPIEMGVFFSYRKEVGRWLALCGKFRKTTQVGTHLGGKKENHHRTAAQM